MRLAFWILLLANLILFFWSQGYLGELDRSREPQRMTRQVSPEKLRVLPAEPPAAPNMACMRIEGLTETEIEVVKGGVASALHGEGSVVLVKPLPAHWVVIPDLPDRAAAEKKKTELRRLGINDGQAVEDAEQGPFAVSMGVFRNPLAAEQLLQTLIHKGVRSARIVNRALPPEKWALDLRAPADLLAPQMAELLANLPHASQAECTNP